MKEVTITSHDELVDLLTYDMPLLSNDIEILIQTLHGQLKAHHHLDQEDYVPIHNAALATALLNSYNAIIVREDEIILGRTSKGTDTPLFDGRDCKLYVDYFL